MKFSEYFAVQEVGPWNEYVSQGPDESMPYWEDVDPMVRGVWKMVQIISQAKIANIDNLWIDEFIEKNTAAEERGSDGDRWATMGSSLREYFYSDGFANLKYNLYSVTSFLESKGDYTYVDWMASPAAVKSAYDTVSATLDAGIAMGLGAHCSPDQLDELASKNIHFIEGSILDPEKHAQMLEFLGDRQIDLFTARPKGGVGMLPLAAGGAAANYYYRLTNFIYERLSPGGFMFFELPQKDVTWYVTTDEWVNLMKAQGIDADTNSGSLVIRKGDQPSLPVLENSTIFYSGEAGTKTKCLVANNGERLEKLDQKLFRDLLMVLQAESQEDLSTD